MNNQSARILNGIDNFIAGRADYSSFKKIGLVSNSRAVTADFKINLHALLEAGFDVRYIFSPEHGYFANVRDGDYIDDGSHPDLNIPILSLFTEGHSRNAVAEALAANPVDAVIFDIQDVGVRFYTYIHALGIAMAASASLGTPIIVLDRVNPVGCEIAEGNIPFPEYISELCPFNIPVRYGLTIGELANYLRQTVFTGARLEVVKISGGYSRDMIFHRTGLRWNAPSPAMISPDTALFYPGTCLFEGTNLSEGRGTAAPFQIVGAPFFRPEETAAAFFSALNSLEIKEFDNIALEPLEFIPASSKHENISCRGLRMFFKNSSPQGFRALLFGALLLKAAFDANRENIKFLFSEKSRRFFIDRLCGAPALREAIIAGNFFELHSLYEKWTGACAAFSRVSASARLY